MELIITDIAQQRCTIENGKMKLVYEICVEGEGNAKYINNTGKLMDDVMNGKVKLKAK